MKQRVLVAGGGVAGLEALLALRDLAAEQVDPVLLEPSDAFVYRPSAVAEPFSRGRARRHAMGDIAADLGVERIRDALAEVDDAGRTVLTAGGERLPYDALLVAVGARTEPALRHALTWTPEGDPELFGGLLRDIEEGYSKRIAFVVPVGVAWPLPGYELALMTAWEARGMGQPDVEVTIYTPEEAPLALFGASAGEALQQDLDEVGVTVRTGAAVAEADGRLVVGPGGEPLAADRVIALARAAGPHLRGLPADAEGFIPVDRHGRVEGTDAVWAAGDATTFPVKQGGLASQEADAAAQAIAAAAGADVTPEPFRPVLRGVILTGRGQAWMRAGMESGDTPSDAAHHALFWPPTKIAGRYLSPYLAARDEAEALGETAPPPGAPVELDLERDLPAAAQALRAPGPEG